MHSTRANTCIGIIIMAGMLVCYNVCPSIGCKDMNIEIYIIHKTNTVLPFCKTVAYSRNLKRKVSATECPYACTSQWGLWRYRLLLTSKLPARRSWAQLAFRFCLRTVFGEVCQANVDTVSCLIVVQIWFYNTNCIDHPTLWRIPQFICYMPCSIY